MPDIFLPVNGMEGDLIKNGALLDLTGSAFRESAALMEFSAGAG